MSMMVDLLHDHINATTTKMQKTASEILVFMLQLVNLSPQFIPFIME
jgi:hypothetical protein